MWAARWRDDQSVLTGAVRPTPVASQSGLRVGFRLHVAPEGAAPGAMLFAERSPEEVEDLQAEIVAQEEALAAAREAGEPAPRLPEQLPRAPLIGDPWMPEVPPAEPTEEGEQGAPPAPEPPVMPSASSEGGVVSISDEGEAGIMLPASLAEGIYVLRIFAYDGKSDDEDANIQACYLVLDVQALGEDGEPVPRGGKGGKGGKGGGKGGKGGGKGGKKGK